MKTKNLLFDTILVTISVFLLIGIIKFNPINFHVFDVKESWKDLELTDIYYSKIKSQNARDTSIVIVDIDTLGRESLAALVTKLNDLNPAVIGVDAYFLEPRTMSQDTALAKAFSGASDRLVLGGFFDSESDDAHDHHESKLEWKHTNKLFGTYSNGHINLVGDHSENTTIRYFRPSIQEIPAFASAIVAKYSPAKANTLAERGEEIEAINYMGGYDNFFHFSAKEILDGEGSGIISNKIVLLGFAGSVAEKRSLEDAHFTPLNDQLAGRSFPDMYGVVIHANIISMILREDYITKVPTWINVVLAVMVGGLHIAAYIYFYVQRHKWFHLFAKVSQLFTSILLMAIVIYLLGSTGIKFDPALTLLIILLSVDVLYFFEPVALYLGRKFHYPTAFSHHH